MVLKPEETLTLKSSVVPSNASSQTISYKSIDSNIASVSKNGLIEAVASGNTTIIVSNEDTTTAVTVIVNDHIKTNSNENTNKDSGGVSKEEYPLKISVDKYAYIDSDMLKYLYQEKKTLIISSEDYTIKINGEDIVNYQKEFCTQLKLTKEQNGFSFMLNNGNSLCGPIGIEFNNDNLKGEYLYLYNDAKEKYYLVKTDDMIQLKLDTAGKYMITEVKISGFSVNWLLLALVSIILIGLIVAYIVTKKSYWFW